MVNQEKIFLKIFQHVADMGWVDYTMPDMASDLGLKFHEFYDVFESKDAVMQGFIRYISNLVESKFTPGSNERDNIFDILMLRFESLAPYKAGLIRYYNETVGHATQDIPLMMPVLRAACDHMLRLAVVKDAPYFVHFGAEKMLYVYVQAYKIWIRDNSPDLDLTLIEVDRRLNQVSSFQEFFIKK